jgi:hypothetical protein
VTDAPDDVEALRARVRDLESQLGSRHAEPLAPAGSVRDRQWWRTVLVVVLVTLAALLAPLSVVARWAHDEIGDTDRYVETVTPLASDPAVLNAISKRISQEIFTYIDARQVTSDALTALAEQRFVPSRAADVLPSLSVPLTSAIQSFITDKVDAVVHSDTFEKAWVEANRQAHTQMVNVLTGETGGSVAVSDGEVRVNLASFVEAVKQRLVKDGFAFANRIPDVNATFTIFEAKNIGTAQKWFSWLDTISRVLPVLAVLLLVGAVMLARDRRKTLLGAGLAVALSMVLLGLALNIVRPIYLDAIPDSVLPADAAAAIYDTLVYFIRTALRAVGIVFLAIALAAFWFAPTGAGAAVRGGATTMLRRLRLRASGAGMNTGPVGVFLATYRTFVRVVVVSLGALVYLGLDHPTGTNAVVIIAVVVVVLVVLEFLAAPGTGREERPA